MKSIALILMHLLGVLYSCIVFSQIDTSITKNRTASKFTSKYLRNQTLTYEETIQEYTALTRQFPQCQLTTFGLTDVGKPLHLFVISEDRDFLPATLRQKGKKVLLINNAIHPGEPEGVDASLLFAQKILHNQDTLQRYLKDVVVLIVPFYNIDGGLNRYCCHRANQNGPEELGFRGNARNLDLNRDMMKAESRNTRALINIFQAWDPDLFVDTHTTNGAEYPYTMTLITSQLDKLGQPLSGLVQNTIEPYLYQRMKEHKAEMFPYMNTVHDTPQGGVADFLETPRFTTGYAALFQTIGFVAEANKFMPFPQRVEHTYWLLKTLLESASRFGTQILETRKLAIKEVKERTYFDLSWRLDTTQVQQIPFRAYPVRRERSKLTGTEFLVYDTTTIDLISIPYCRKYQPTLIIEKPKYYILPQAWGEVVERMQLNNVLLQRLKKDTVVRVQSYYITDLMTSPTPYEGHYVHSNIQLKKEEQKVHFFKGDYLIPMNQRANYFLMTALEPQSPDSYFMWNFFDAILMQKEWFSDYKFEATAMEMLQNDPILRADFEQKKASEPDFASDGFKQLHYLFKKSKFYEQSHNRYPVYRVEYPIQLPTY